MIYGISGDFVIRGMNAETGALEFIKHIPNMLMRPNQNFRVAQLMGTQDTLPADLFDIKYIALGIGTTPVTPDDTQLENEQFRKVITRKEVLPSMPHIVLSNMNVLAEEANFVIREIGVFCSSSATSAPNSGAMLSRVNVNIQKNTNLVLNIVRRDICTLTTSQI